MAASRESSREPGGGIVRTFSTTMQAPAELAWEALRDLRQYPAVFGNIVQVDVLDAKGAVVFKREDANESQYIKAGMTYVEHNQMSADDQLYKFRIKVTRADPCEFTAANNYQSTSVLSPQNFYVFCTITSTQTVEKVVAGVNDTETGDDGTITVVNGEACRLIWSYALIPNNWLAKIRLLLVRNRLRRLLDMMYLEDMADYKRAVELRYKKQLEEQQEGAKANSTQTGTSDETALEP